MLDSSFTQSERFHNSIRFSPPAGVGSCSHERWSRPDILSSAISLSAMADGMNHYDLFIVDDFIYDAVITHAEPVEP